MTGTEFGITIAAAVFVLILGIRELVRRKLVTSVGTTTYRGNIWLGITMVFLSAGILVGVFYRLGLLTIPGLSQ